MATKLTIPEMYEQIIAKCDKVLTANELDFLVERKALHEKKNANRKPTKAQAENNDIKADILASMVKGKQYTVSELMKVVPSCAELTNQRVSALVRQLKENGEVTRTEIKGKAYFKLA